MELILKFFLGAVMGSAANALIYRLPRRISWWRGRSFCPECKHALAWYDLIPLLSYLLLGGKCRYCHKPIPLRYFLVELFLALSALSGLSLLSYLILWVTVIIAVMDWETMLVSQLLVAFWGLLVLINNLQFTIYNFYGLLAGVVLIGGIWLVTRGKGMGDGDIEIAAVLGWWLGWPWVLLGLWLAFVLGGVWGVVALLGKRATLKSQLPFGPFLILGGWLGVILYQYYL